MQRKRKAGSSEILTSSPAVKEQKNAVAEKEKKEHLKTARVTARKEKAEAVKEKAAQKLQKSALPAKKKET